MTNKDIVDLYKSGYSLNYIVKAYYSYATRNDVQNHKFNNTFIITKKSITLQGAKKHVKNVILKFAISNKAN